MYHNESNDCHIQYWVRDQHTYLVGDWRWCMKRPKRECWRGRGWCREQPTHSTRQRRHSVGLDDLNLVNAFSNYFFNEVFELFLQWPNPNHRLPYSEIITGRLTFVISHGWVYFQACQCNNVNKSAWSESAGPWRPTPGHGKWILVRSLRRMSF